MTYGYIGSVKAKPGCRGDVVSILVHGCRLYIVGVSSTDDDTIWVTEV